MMISIGNLLMLIWIKVVLVILLYKEKQLHKQRLNTYRQCTYNIPVRCICATIGAMEKQ